MSIFDPANIDPSKCWRCPLVQREAMAATCPDPWYPADDAIKVCVPCAFDRSTHPNRPKAEAAA